MERMSTKEIYTAIYKELDSKIQVISDLLSWGAPENGVSYLF